MKGRLENENRSAGKSSGGLTFITDDGDEERHHRRADAVSTPELGPPARRKRRDPQSDHAQEDKYFPRQSKLPKYVSPNDETRIDDATPRLRALPEQLRMNRDPTTQERRETKERRTVSSANS